MNYFGSLAQVMKQEACMKDRRLEQFFSILNVYFMLHVLIVLKYPIDCKEEQAHDMQSSYFSLSLSFVKNLMSADYALKMNPGSEIPFDFKFSLLLAYT